MKAYKTLLLVMLLVLPVAAFAQKVSPRQILNGKVIADSLAVESLNVNNISSHIGAVTDEKGLFTIYARANDTLTFSSVNIHPVKIVLKESDFSQRQLVIKLNVNVTVLDEVIILPTRMIGDLGTVSKNTKTNTITSGIDGVDLKDTYTEMKFKPIEYKVDEVVNGALPAQMHPLRGVDFARIYRLYIKKDKKTKKDRGEVYSAEAQKTFAEAVKERFTYNFFTEALKIPANEIALFLNFSDTGEASKALLEPKKEFELTDYLVTKSEEYLKGRK
ncbi:hypothetical protein [Flavobacterium subsaxonicum]|uniref:Uncharacterized protein n=1 Tax=Flavobacterium subsaxonicum WB 4.1-42 = DSM 21790 TaxID=1121898 RepID=A0A0A2MHG4_9FLAO|nr:hypothetical protein [Flavobacterium subsaxonicum]KGO92097.1 hypothetical protein Q766_14485 [Flavobacterium subsaxonicum WB 4.1-42 = DSM 21790]